MATRKRTSLRSRDVPVKRELKGKPPFGFRFQLFFCRSYSRRSAAVCPFPTADHPPAPECFFRGRWMILIISAPLPFPIPVKSLFQFPLCHNDRSNDNDALQCTHNSPNIPYAVVPFSENTRQNNYRNRNHYKPTDIPELPTAVMRVFPGLFTFHRHRRPVSIYPVNLLRRLL